MTFKDYMSLKNETKEKKGTEKVQYFQKIHNVCSDFRHLRFLFGLY